MTRLIKALKRAGIAYPEAVAEQLTNDRLPSDPAVIHLLLTAGLLALKPTPTAKLDRLTHDPWDQLLATRKERP